MARIIYTINRIAGMMRHAEQIQQRNALINSQVGIEKDKPTEYKLNSVNFNPDTRNTRIEIVQTQYYRTIDKYVTRNYQKYPIYSQWKTRSKIITKSIKLTNLEIESLNKHSDQIIRKFAEQIVIGLKNDDLIPSWFIIKNLRLNLKEKLNAYDKEMIEYKNKANASISKCNDYIVERTEYIEISNKQIESLQKKLNRQIGIINRINNSNRNILKYLFSFGIYAYLISAKRKMNVTQKINSYSAEINQKMSYISEMQSDISKYTNNIYKYKQHIIDKTNSIITAKKNLEKETLEKINSVQPLKNTIDTTNANFMPLKYISGMQYERITGCYIIHNIEKDKYYVGQSKDVLKRLKQHFKGTIPINSIFAEDYYTSNMANKDNLFEVRIIRCYTKDELDSLEKELIFDYDSLNNGYNRTSGNT